MLPLTQIKDGHDGCFFVLWWVSLQDLFDELVVLLIELEWNAGIVLGGISMLQESLSVCLQRVLKASGHSEDVRRLELTTMRASLPALEEATNDLHWNREATRAGLNADRNSFG